MEANLNQTDLYGIGNAGAGTSPGPQTFSRQVPGDCTTQTQRPALTTTITDGDLGCR